MLLSSLTVVQWVELFASVVLAFATIGLFWATWVLGKETRTTRKLQVEPRISIRVEPSSYHTEFFELVISNDGLGAARNFRCRFEGHAPIEDLVLIRNGLEHFAPNQTFRYLFELTGNEFENAKRHPWKFCIEYDNRDGDKQSEAQTVDFSLLEDAHIPIDIADGIRIALESIASSLENNSNKEPIDSFTREGKGNV